MTNHRQDTRERLRRLLRRARQERPLGGSEIAAAAWELVQLSSTAIPFAAIERVAETLEQRVNADNAEELLAALDAWPDGVPFRDELATAARERVLASAEDADAAALPLDTLVRRAELLAERARWEEALRDAETALARAPQNVGAAKVVVRALLASRRPAEAFQRLGGFIERHPAETLFRRERSAIALGHHYGQAAWLDAEPLLVSADGGERLFAAEVALSQGRTEPARTLAQDAAAPHSRFLLAARASFVDGDVRAAAALAAHYLEASEERAGLMTVYWHRLDALALLADAYTAVGDYAAAMEACFKAWALGEPSYRILRRYARATIEATAGPARETERRLLTAIAERGAEDDTVEPFVRFLASTSDPRTPLFGSDPPDDAVRAAAAERWLEPGMRAEFTGGLPISVLIPILANVVLIERRPWVHTVRDLDATDIEPGEPEACRALLAQSFPALRRLTIRSPAFDFEHVQLLVAAPFFPRLEALTLLQTAIDAPALEVLVDKTGPRLRELSIRDADAVPSLPIGGSIGGAFARSRSLSALELLDLTACALTPSDVLTILGSELPSLRRLVLTANDLTTLSPADLLTAPRFRQLEAVVLRDTGIEREVVRAVVADEDLALRRLVAPADWPEGELAALRADRRTARFEVFEVETDDARERQWLRLLDESEPPLP